MKIEVGWIYTTGPRLMTGIQKMKVKIDKLCLTILVITLCSIFLLCCTACNNYVSCDFDSNNADEEIDLLRVSLETNYNLIAVNHPIEISFLTDELRFDGSTYSMQLYYEKYLDLWSKELKKYTNLVAKKMNESDSIQYMAHIENWYDTLEEQVELYFLLQTEKYGDGTIIASNLVRYKMELYRTKALEQIALYYDLNAG